jgi:hypothetical protein
VGAELKKCRDALGATLHFLAYPLDKLELVYLFFFRFTMSLINKAIVPHTATIEAMYAISLCIEKL